MLKAFSHDKYTLYWGNVAVSYLWKVKDVKNFEDLLHKLNMICLLDSYDK